MRENHEEKRRERDRLPLGVPPVDGEERGRGEVVGMREREVRERNFGCKWWKSRRKKKKKKLLGGSGSRQNGVVLLVQNDVVWLSEKFEFCRHERQVVRSHETTRRFLLIRTTSRSIHTNDTPFASATERLVVCHERHAVWTQPPNDWSFAPFFSRFLFFHFQSIFTYKNTSKSFLNFIKYPINILKPKINISNFKNKFLKFNNNFLK